MRWTTEEINFLIKNHNKYTLKEISQILGNRNNSNVSRKAKELGINWGKKKKVEGTTKGYRDENNVWHKKGWKRKTKEEIAETRRKIMKEWYKKHDHPRGMKGKTQSEETRKRFSQRMIEDWQNPNSAYNSEKNKQAHSDYMTQWRISNRSNNYSRTKGGKRADLNNQYFRSSWEANYARYLNFLVMKKQIYKWEYEPDTYYFEEVKRGIRSYTPDFKIWETKNSNFYYVEVKGWMDKKSTVKLNRMAKYYPNIEIRLFQKEEYKELKNKLGRVIENWED